ncbi:MAG: TlpA disulfide reductase family protein [Cocleimonas sp.]
MNIIINKMHKKTAMIIRTIFFSLFFLLSFNANAEFSTDLTLIDHKPPAPDFSLPDMNGKLHALSDYRGKPVIVSFWGTWCPPCLREIPQLNRAWEKLKDDDVVMLFVNINEGIETIEAYKKKVPIKLTILRDETAGQLQNWNMIGLPAAFIIDPEGRVVYQALAEREWDSDEILDKVRALRTKQIEKPNREIIKTVKPKHSVDKVES